MSEEETKFLDFILQFFSEELERIRELQEYKEWESFMDTDYQFKLNCDPDGDMEQSYWENLRDALEDFFVDLARDQLQIELSVESLFNIMSDLYDRRD